MKQDFGSSLAPLSERLARHPRFGFARKTLKTERGWMDISWVTDQIGVGGGIWNDAKMIEVVKAGVTHIINMQIEFDDRPLAKGYDIEVLWAPTEDDFQPKPPALLKRGVDFAVEALKKPTNKVFIHCAAGVHRAPMMTLAILRCIGWNAEDAMRMIQTQRPVVDFADVYVESVESFMESTAESV